MITIDYIIKSSRKASKFLARDFAEIQNMKHFSNLPKFINALKLRTKDMIGEELGGFSYIKFMSEYVDKAQNVIVLSQINGLSNFIAGMPFFGFSILFQQVIDGEVRVRNFMCDLPALNTILFGEDGEHICYEGGGSSKKKCFLSTRVCPEIIIINDASIANKFDVQGVRIFGSDLYSLFLLLTGRCEVVILNTTFLDEVTKLSINFIVKNTKLYSKIEEEYIFLSSLEYNILSKNR